MNSRTEKSNNHESAEDNLLRSQDMSHSLVSFNSVQYSSQKFTHSIPTKMRNSSKNSAVERESQGVPRGVSRGARYRSAWVKWSVFWGAHFYCCTGARLLLATPLDVAGISYLYLTKSSTIQSKNKNKLYYLEEIVTEVVFL